MEFVNDSVVEYKGRMTFKIDKGTNYISVDANFRKDLDLNECFNNVFIALSLGCPYKKENSQ